MAQSDNPVVISGLAPISAIGTGRARSWRALLDGVVGIAPISRFDVSDFPVKLAGEVHDVRPEASIDRRLLVATDRWTQHGIVAAQLAAEDASIEPDDLRGDDVTVVTAAGSGGNEFGQREIEALWSRGPKAVTVYQSIAWFYAATTGQLSIRLGAKGPCGVLAGGATAGLDIFSQVSRGLGRVARLGIVGATEAGISPYAMICQLNGGRLSTSDDANRAYQPFGEGTEGHVVGEGGAMFVVERARSCRDRGGRARAVFTSHAATHDGRRRHSEDVAVRGGGLADAIELALSRASLSPSDIDVVFADGAGSADLDAAELHALRSALGAHASSVAVTVPKAATGRMEAGSACFDVAAAVSAIDDQVVPPTVNVGTLRGDCDVDLVRTARPTPIRHALVLARSPGGANAAAVLSAAA